MRDSRDLILKHCVSLHEVMCCQQRVMKAEFLERHSVDFSKSSYIVANSMLFLTVHQP